MGEIQTPPAVQLRNISKSFGPVCVLKDVDLAVASGSIHAVVGENGAGKTTVMKMLYGQYQPDSGEIFIDGRLRQWRSPRDALAAGIGMVHQHFMLARPLDAIDNAVLGIEDRWAYPTWLPLDLRIIDRSGLHKRLTELAERFGMPLTLDQPVEQSPVGEQQRLEILRLILQEAQILILDEPTAVLTPQEVEGFFENLRILRDAGKTILIVTHKLKEVMALCDTVSVLRSGRMVAERRVKDTSIDELAYLMVGRRVNLRPETGCVPGKQALLTVEGLNLGGAHPLTFSIRTGEVLGIAGVEGNGQDALIEAVTRPGEHRYPCASVKLEGHELKDLSGWQVRMRGVGLIPQDRQRQGLNLSRSLAENFLLGRQRDSQWQSFGFLHRARVRKAAQQALEEFQVCPLDLDIPAQQLSGGNQQKLIIARELARQPRLLIAVNPTRGVDVGSIEFVQQKIIEARSLGVAVLLISSDIDEVLALADRVCVLFRHSFVREFQRKDVNERELGLAMGGAHENKS